MITGTIHPVRVLDTRPGSGQQGAGETLGPDSTLSFFPGTATFPGEVAAVPDDATAVVLNVTEATSTADSFLTVWATGGSQPLASNLNFPGRQDRAEPSDRADRPGYQAGVDLQLRR